MKQVTAVLCAGMLILSLNACSKNPAAPEAPAAAKQVKGQQIITAWKFSHNANCPAVRPYGLFVDNLNYAIYATDTATGKVWDIYRYTWWTTSIVDSQNRLTSPAGIAKGADHTLYVADITSHSVQRYRNGSWTGTWGKVNLQGATIAGSETGAFNHPNGVAWDSPYVYVCDKGNNRIQKIDTRNNSSTVIDQVFTSSGQRVLFNYPMGIAADNSHCIYVTDASGVKKFQGDKLLASWDGSKGIGRLSRASGIALSPSGWDVYVVDGGNNRVQVFDNNGNYINSFGSAGTGNGQFGLGSLYNTYSAGIAVRYSNLGNDLVYVADPGNKRVQIWEKYRYVSGFADYRQ